MKIKLAPMHREVAAHLPGEVAVLHAALDVRAAEMVLALGLAHPGESAAVLPDMHAALFRLRKWSDESGLKLHREVVGKCRWVSLGDSSVLLVPHGEPIPTRGLDFVGIVGADSISESPVLWARPKMSPGASLVVCGLMPARDTWWHSFLSKAGARTEMPAEVVVSQFPDQAALVNPEAPDYERSMLLIDRPVHIPPFFTFSRKRLKLRTEKRYDQLTKLQQSQVDEQPHADKPIVSLDLHAVQRRYFAMKELGRRRGFSRFVTVKYRRAGITTSEEGFAYRRCCEYSGTQALFLADTEEKTKRLFGNTRSYYELDPKQPQLKSPPSMTGMDFANGSRFFCATAGGTGARGDGVSIVHWTEVPFAFKGAQATTKADHLLSALLGACPNGELTLEGTPRGRELLYEKYQEAKRAMSGEDKNGRYWPIFLRWFDDPRNAVSGSGLNAEEVRDTLTGKERRLIKMHGLSPGQIAFRRDIEREHGRLFQQEYPEDDETCFYSTGTCYFNGEALHPMLDTLKEERGEKVAGLQAWLKTWAPPEEGHRYVLGVDTSEGIPGCDPNGIGVLDVTNGLKPVACLHGHMRPEELAMQAKVLSERYSNSSSQRALIGVERQNHGHAVLLELKNLGLGRPHDDGGDLYFHANGRPGWSTTEGTRPLLLSALDRAVSDGSFVPGDRELVTECLTFILGDRGKFGAASGMHDDRVFKWGIAIQMAGVNRRSGVSIRFGRL